MKRAQRTVVGRGRRRLDLRTQVGSVELAAPVLTAAGTAGFGAELSAFFDLSGLGAVVVKSLSAEPWPGNPAPRITAAGAGMLNSVGLQGPGVEAWLADDLPALVAAGATVVASIWGRTVDEFRRAADLLAAAPSAVVAVEVNVSCPNLEARNQLFAHDPATTAEVVAATAGCGRPRWAKLSPNTDGLVEVAAAAHEAGAEAVTLVNTLLGLVVDVEARRPVLGAGGGLSGPPLHPVAVRAVHDVRRALPDLPVVGVGGVDSGAAALELLLVGASAVQVGTATFADPRAPLRVQSGLARWCRAHGVSRVADLVGAALPPTVAARPTAPLAAPAAARALVGQPLESP